MQRLTFWVVDADYTRLPNPIGTNPDPGFSIFPKQYSDVEEIEKELLSRIEEVPEGSSLYLFFEGSWVTFRDLKALPDLVPTAINQDRLHVLVRKPRTERARTERAALSLSLSENARNVNVHSSADVGIFDMSYENLVLLENVKCAASSAIVSSLTGFIFDGSNQTCSSENVDELCAICQNEYKVGDSLMLLPCTHNFHDACGSEWLLNHSKLCPVCKHDVTDKA